MRPPTLFVALHLEVQYVLYYPEVFVLYPTIA